MFRAHARSHRVQDAGPETLAGDLRTCADHYRAFVLGEEPDPELTQAFRELADLDMKPVWPFLLHLYGDYAGGRLSRHDLITLTRLVTAYAMRRAVCGYKPAAPPPVFAKAPRAIEPDRYVESVRAHFLSLPDGHAFPSDDAFRAELTTRNMYRFRHRDAVLERLENHGRKETVQLASYTVDHIMPQGERLPEAWKAELGPDWAQVWHTWRHIRALRSGVGQAGRHRARATGPYVGLWWSGLSQQPYLIPSNGRSSTHLPTPRSG